MAVRLRRATWSRCPAGASPRRPIATIAWMAARSPASESHHWRWSVQLHTGSDPMTTADTSLFSISDLERLIVDLDNTLRIMHESIAALAYHDAPAPRLIHIAELEAR